MHVYGLHVPCDARREMSLVRNERGSFSFSPLTSAAATEDRFVTVIVHVIRPPTTTVVGLAVFVTARSSSGGGGGGPEAAEAEVAEVAVAEARVEAEAEAEVAGGGGGPGGGGGGGGPGGGGGVGGVPFLRFVNVQTTASPRATAPSTLVPVTETSTVPLRVHSTLES